MTTQEYIHRLNNPHLISKDDTKLLKDLLDDFPFLQSARALYLKSLHQERSFLYNNELKKTAAHTTDRDVLFDFIISGEFITYQALEIDKVDVVDADVIENKKPLPTLDENIEKRVLDTLVYIENADKETELIQKIDKISKAKSEAKLQKKDVSFEENIQELEDKLEVGKPLDFSENDKLSFTEWLKLTSAQPIEREIEEKTTDTIPLIENEKQKKLELIDKFIENNPKIIPSKTAVAPPIHIGLSDDDEPFFMTETLARIYLEQKKFQKAIQAYEILILKYPEKSSLFANRIADIKKLQEFNNT